MDYKEEFIEFLVQCNALKFGRFELKSGRIAPYFINAGMFNTGARIRKLGEFYAKAVKEHFADDFDGIYGPAYKGIPLCISAAQALADMGMDKGYGPDGEGDGETIDQQDCPALRVTQPD